MLGNIEHSDALLIWRFKIISRSLNYQVYTHKTTRKPHGETMEQSLPAEMINEKIDLTKRLEALRSWTIGTVTWRSGTANERRWLRALPYNRIAIIEIYSKCAVIDATGPGSLRVSFGAVYTHGRLVLFACDSSWEEARSVEFGNRASPQDGEGGATTAGRDGVRYDLMG